MQAYIFRILIIAPVMIGLSACTPPGGACQMTSVADLKVLNDRGSPIVAATISGKPVAFIVDTGAEYSMITNDAVDTYNMERVDQTVRMTGLGGDVSVGVSMARDVGLGTASASRAFFLTDFPSHRKFGELPIVGLLGDDFLMLYDVVLDLPDHKINLYRTAGCDQASLPLWSGASYPMPIEPANKGDTHVYVTMKINGHAENVVLDSGASQTIISRSDALDAGITKASLKLNAAGTFRGVDDRALTGYAQTFHEIQIGHIILHDQKLPVLQTDTTLIGASFLWTHRVWIAYPNHTLYIQPTGPVTKIP